MHHRPDIEDETGQGGRSPRKPPHSRRLAKVALLGGFVALLTRSGVRGRVLDKLFGPEEEFEYESETEPEPLTDLSSEPVSGAGDADDHDEEGSEEPAGDSEAGGESWASPPAQDAVPLDGEDPPAAEDPEAAAQPSEPPFAPAGPRIFAVPSVPASDQRPDEVDGPPAAGDADRRDAPPSYVPTPPASYVPTPPASDVPGAPASDIPADLEPEAPQPPPAPPESASERDARYSWGGNARGTTVVEILAPPADEQPPGEESRAATGEVRIPRPAVTDRPRPHVDELTDIAPSRFEFVPPGGSPAPASSPLDLPSDDELEAPAPRQELTAPPSRSPQWESPVESLERHEAGESDDGAPGDSEAWTPAPPFVIGEDSLDREPEAEPWRTSPSIVIENGDLILDRESDAPAATPWRSSETNGGGTPRPWTSANALEPQAAFGAFASDVETPPIATADAWSTESLADDEPLETVEASSTPAEPAVWATDTEAGASEPVVADAAPVSADAEPADADAAPPFAGAQGTLGEVDPAVGEADPAVGEVDPAVGEAHPAVGEAHPAVGDPEPAVGAREPYAAPASSESVVASAASGESPQASAPSADGAVATAVRGEPGIGEAAPRRSGWWLSRRRRGSVPEPPRWD